jgi:hypothetical protein
MKSNIFDAVAELDFKLKKTDNTIYESITALECEYSSMIMFKSPECIVEETKKLLGIINGSIIIYSKKKDTSGDNIPKAYLNVQFCSLIVECRQTSS